MKYTSDRQPCVVKLKAIADTTRLSVLEALMDGTKRVGEFVNLLQVEQSLLSHHLKVLRDIGLVKTKREGKSILYRLAADIKGSVTGKSIDLKCCQLVFNADK